MDKKVKPILMQLLEPEYMCPECGYKFYIYNKNKKPKKCEYCNTTFEWGEKMMSFHHCCNTWKWCDGDCKKCSVTQTTYTTSSGTKKRKFELR